MESNRALPSSKNSRFQNEARCTTFLVKISFICMRMRISIPKAEHLSSFWNGGPKELGNDLLCCGGRGGNTIEMWWLWWWWRENKWWGVELRRSRKGRKVSKTWCFKVGQKYSTARRIFNSLLGVSSGDETLRLMLDILRNTYLLYSMSL